VHVSQADPCILIGFLLHDLGAFDKLRTAAASSRWPIAFEEAPPEYECLEALEAVEEVEI
jgi:hypothetical protein